MDPRLLRYYNQELRHLREMGAEFAAEFPKIAARLGMDGVEVSDPYVERLIESFAFLAGRVQLKLDAEFPRFTHRLLEILYPQFLAPTPSMVVARFLPDLNDGNLARGVAIPRGSTMHGHPARGEETAAEFRTAHEVRLLPIEVASAAYFTVAPDLPLTQLGLGNRIKGGLRIRLRTGAELPFSAIDLSHLNLHFSGLDEVTYRLNELVHGACLGVLALPVERPIPWREWLPPESVRPVGYSDSEALLPTSLRGFQGYRLIHEYFSFPQRFLFADLVGLERAASRCEARELEVVLLFSRGEPSLESVVDAGNISLFCTPAINLLSRRAERIHLTDPVYEHHVVPDRTRPMDFEVYDVESVTGHGVGPDSERDFLPFYAAFHTDAPGRRAYFTLQREPRLHSSTQRTRGARSSYLGSEVFISLVDSEEAPYPEALRQLSLTVLCTNRDLPLLMPVGQGKTDLTLDNTAPILGIRILKGPSRPTSCLREGGLAWQFINHLSLNYLSLVDADAQQGAAALRDMLALYALAGDQAVARQIEGLHHVRTRPLVRRLPFAGPIAFGRGLEVELEVDELAFLGGSAFLFGAVMEHFLARHVSLNSFTETVLRSSSRGEMMRWRPRCGARPIL
ncbi:MAG: type VI secretion system baseplate subunit TssF [Zoogloeaceae bacterium]|nr:type VI secretion system baseplate subunit TssF [Zoogloeaceae bacterium]